MRADVLKRMMVCVASVLLWGTLAGAQASAPATPRDVAIPRTAIDAAAPDATVEGAAASENAAGTAAAPAASVQGAGTHSAVPELKVRPAHFLPKKDDEVLWAMHEHVPLGTESVMLPNGKRRATVLASAESPALEGILVFMHNGVKHIVHSDGTPVTTLPSHITFRISATGALTLREAAVPIDTKCDLQQFVDGLVFIAKVFHSDMQEQSYKPVAVKQVGVPLSVPAQTRIYRASFNLGELSVNDHIVLLVNTSSGDPVAKFFLQLN